MYLQFLYSLHFPFFSLSSVFFLLLQSLYPRKGGKNPLPLQPERQTFKPRRRIVQSFRADSRMERNKSTSRRGAARGCSYIAKKKIPSGRFNSRIPLSSTSSYVSFKDRPSKRSVFSIFNKVFSPLSLFFFFLRRKNYYPSLLSLLRLSEATTKQQQRTKQPFVTSYTLV